MSQENAPPGPKGHLLVGHAWELWRDQLGFLTAAATEHGGVVKLRAGVWPFFLITDPEAIRRVLQENHANYDKDLPGYRLLKVAIGEGLVTSRGGERWRCQRRLIQPAFHGGSLVGYGPIITDVVHDMLSAWRAHGPSGTELDICEEMSAVTLRIIGKLLFSHDLFARSTDISQALTIANSELMRKAASILPLPIWIPTPGNLRLRAAIRQLQHVVQETIERRRARTVDDSADLLSMMLAARDGDTGEGLDEGHLRDELLTLTLAGHETTAMTLTWTWHLLSQHPDVQARVHAEVDGALGSGPADANDLERLPFLHQVVMEAMRLYPPVWALGRRAISQDRLAGYRIPAGSYVIVSPYVVHRLASFWKDPLNFDPDRFSPKHSQPGHSYAYIPFARGPRMCLGSEFAMMEAVLILAMVSRQVKLQGLPDHNADPHPLITLRPRNGMPMRLEWRHPVPVRC